MDAKYVVDLFVFLAVTVGQAAGDRCYRGAFYKDCAGSCCGSYGDQDCCADIDIEDVGTVGVIVGAVIGGIIFLVIVVSIIVAVVCCLRSQRARTGRVLTPNTGVQGQPNMTVYPAATNPAYPTSYPQNQYPMGQVPYPTNQYSSPAGFEPPSYTQATGQPNSEHSDQMKNAN